MSHRRIARCLLSVTAGRQCNADVADTTDCARCKVARAQSGLSPGGATAVHQPTGSLGHFVVTNISNFSLRPKSETELLCKTS